MIIPKFANIIPALTDTALKISQCCFTTSISHGVENCFPGCGVRASLMLFLHKVVPPCHSNQVDFRAPPLKSITDFLLYMFQDTKLQLGTIDGYRSAIARQTRKLPINVNKDGNLTRLLDSFHSHRPKGRRSIPSFNLSLVFTPAGKRSL